MSDRRFTGFGRIAAVMALAFAMAVPATLARADEEIAEGPNLGRVSVAGGIDFTSEYYFRGIFQENQGLIAQPWLDVSFEVVDGWTVFIGTWNSLHDGPSGDAGTGSLHYELDFYAGVSTSFDIVSVDVVFTSYTSPNGVFSTVSEIAVTVGIDDTGLWQGTGFTPEGFSLAPYVTVAFELGDSYQADAGNGNTPGTSAGVYLELGIEPAFTLIEGDPVSLTLSVPIAVGLSLSDYYEFGAPPDDETYGFFSIGVTLTMPLEFIPAEFGAWEAYVNVSYLNLGDSTELASDDTDQDRVIATGGVSFAY